MGNFVEIGANQGQAAPGERSPDALLTTAGRVLMRDPTTGIIGLKYPPGYLIAQDLVGASAPSISSEASLFAASPFTNVFPAEVAAGDAIDLTARGTWTPGGTQTWTLNLYMGSTVIFTGTSGSLATGSRIWWMKARIVYVTSTTIKVLGEMMLATVVGSGAQTIAANSSWAFSDGVTQTPSGTIANCDLKGHGSGASNAQLTAFQANYVPKNY